MHVVVNERLLFCSHDKRENNSIFNREFAVLLIHDLQIHFKVYVGQCEDPNVPRNGSVHSNHGKNGTFQFGAIVQFVCNVGFILVGSPSIQCVLGNSSNESVWNASTPICQGRPILT